MDVYVFPTRIRQPTTQFGIYQAADKNKKTNQYPESKNGIEGLLIARDNLRRRVNARTNGNADQDSNAVENAERFA